MYGEGLVPSEAAGKALTYSIVGLFCFGMVFGPMAIAKALEARKEIQEDPSMAGLGKANVGLLLGLTDVISWVLYLIEKFKD